MEDSSGTLLGMKKTLAFEPNEKSSRMSQIPNWREDPKFRKKSPFSFLLELMDKQKKMTTIRIFSEDRIFHCQVSVDEYQAVAIGRSKIDAKQAAAKAFIEEFITNWNFPMLKENPHPVRHPDKRAETSKASSRPPRRRKRRPKKKAESKNFVGVLHEFCLIKQFPSPRYFIESQSQPEDSLTTFYTSCNVQDLQVFGAGRTMDIAKQRAAEAMCEQLNI